MQTLATIGYERAAMEDFLAALGLARVRVLVDVRAVAASRRKGFSKTALAEALAAADTARRLPAADIRGRKRSMARPTAL